MKQLTLFADENTCSELPEGKGHGIFFPCPTAREMPIGEARCNHIKHCSECQRLIQELDKECGVKQ